MDQEAGILAVCRLGAGTGLTAVCRLPRLARREGVSCPLSCSAPSGGSFSNLGFILATPSGGFRPFTGVRLGAGIQAQRSLRRFPPLPVCRRES